MPLNAPNAIVGDNAAAILIDSAAQSADTAIRSSQRVANQTLDQLAESVDNARAQAGPALNRLANDAQALTRRGVDAVRAGSQQLRGQASRATDSTVGYIQAEPVKSMLIAAAVGAVLMALITLVGRAAARD